MVLTHIDLKYVSLIYRKIRQKVPNGKGLINRDLKNQTLTNVFAYIPNIQSERNRKCNKK